MSAIFFVLPRSQRLAPKNKPSSNGILKRGNPCSFSSVREISWMPSLHWSMMSRIFSIRTSPESYASNEHRATYPQSWIANTMAWNIGSYSASKGQLTKMLSLYLRFGAARGPRARTRPYGIDYFDLPATFFADFLMACAALLARWTSAFFATGEDFIVRTRTVISRDYASRLVLSILAP